MNGHDEIYGSFKSYMDLGYEDIKGIVVERGKAREQDLNQERLKLSYVCARSRDPCIRREKYVYCYNALFCG